LSDFYNDTNKVDCLLLNKLLNPFKSDEREPLLLYLVVLFSFCDISILIKGQTVVVLDRCILLICKFDLPIREKIDFVLLNQRAELSDGFLPKEGSLHLGAVFVYQFDVHQGTLPSGIAPVAGLITLGHASSDTPICRELIQNSNWSVHILDRTHPSSSLVQVACITVSSLSIIDHRRRHDSFLFFFMSWESVASYWLLVVIRGRSSNVHPVKVIIE
jgi:hypothetical protein